MRDIQLLDIHLILVGSRTLYSGHLSTKRIYIRTIGGIRKGLEEECGSIGLTLGRAVLKGDIIQTFYDHRDGRMMSADVLI